MFSSYLTYKGHVRQDKIFLRLQILVIALNMYLTFYWSLTKFSYSHYTDKIQILTNLKYTVIVFFIYYKWNTRKVMTTWDSVQWVRCQFSKNHSSKWIRQITWKFVNDSFKYLTLKILIRLHRSHCFFLCADLSLPFFFFSHLIFIAQL